MTRGLDFSPEEVAEAVRTLTTAQRRTIAAGELRYGPGYWPLRSALVDKGLMITANREPVLTPFGRAVRAALRSDQ